MAEELTCVPEDPLVLLIVHYCLDPVLVSISLCTLSLPSPHVMRGIHDLMKMLLSPAMLSLFVAAWHNFAQLSCGEGPGPCPCRLCGRVEIGCTLSFYSLLFSCPKVPLPLQGCLHCMLVVGLCLGLDRTLLLPAVCVNLWSYVSFR